MGARAACCGLLLLAALPAVALECSPLVVNQPADPATISHGHGLLWRINGIGGATSYLFGTMHVSDPRVLDVLSHVATEFAASGQFVLEVLFDAEVAAKLRAAMFYQDGQRLADSAGGELALAAAGRLADFGIPAELALTMKPWAAFTTLSMPRGTNSVPLDLQLLARAERAGMPIHGLESVAEQIAVFEQLGPALQVALLRETVCNFDLFQRELEALVAAYVARDLVTLMIASDRYAGADQAALLDALLWQRNQRMVARLEPLLAAGPTFIAIGALHLPGPRGVLALLEQRGYRVEAVY